MADMSTFLRNSLRNHIFRTASFSKPTALWVSLHVADPGRTGADEVSTSGTGYGRVQVDPLDANWTAPSDGTTENAADIEFGTPTGDWTPTTQIGYAGIWDAETAGNFLAKATLAAAKNVNDGDPAPKFEAGNLVFVFD